MKRGEEPAADQLKQQSAKQPLVKCNEKSSTRLISTSSLPNSRSARTALEQLIDESEAYIAKSEFTGNVGAKRTGFWTIRVPVARFHHFASTVTSFGLPQRHATDAQDVTEEYVDVQAPIKNLKEEEETLNRLLKENAKSFADIQSWKEKIAMVRREIGRYEARLQTLGRLSAMSTVHVTLKDEKDYVPETLPADAPRGPNFGRFVEGAQRRRQLDVHSPGGVAAVAAVDHSCSFCFTTGLEVVEQDCSARATG